MLVLGEVLRENDIIAEVGNNLYACCEKPASLGGSEPLFGNEPVEWNMDDKGTCLVRFDTTLAEEHSIGT